MDEVNLKSKLNKEMFAIMLQDFDSESGYKKSDSTEWPEKGYIFNTEMSGCMDEEGKQIKDENILTFNDEAHIAIVDTDKTVYCYLYFDKKAEPLNCIAGIPTLSAGDRYINGKYTYLYKQSKQQNTTGLHNFNEEGWGVYLTDTNSTEPIKGEEICSTVDGKPVVSAQAMFNKSKATSIDLSGWDTSQLIYMEGMFSGAYASTINLTGIDTSNVTSMRYMFDNNFTSNVKGLNKLNTGKVTDMRYMFQNSSAENLDLSNWDTSRVSTMEGMFNGAKATYIDLSGWNTQNLTRMYMMFNNAKATEVIGLNDLNTSKVTTMQYAFNGAQVQNINISKWNTAKVDSMQDMFNRSQASSIIIGEKDTTSLTTASGMFANTPNLTEIDLSGVDVSKLDVDMMFTNTGATVGWAKDATNASILNRSYQKPSTLTFKVKE